MSTLYPMYIASQLANPSLERSWKITSKPIQEVWEVPLPFQLTDEKDVDGLIRFLKEFMNAHGSRDAPNFYSADLNVIEEKTEVSERQKKLVAKTYLFPYDVGVIQNFTLQIFEGKKGKWLILIQVERLQGDYNSWQRLNWGFFDMIRKQVLLWTNMKQTAKVRYQNKNK